MARDVRGEEGVTRLVLLLAMLALLCGAQRYPPHRVYLPEVRSWVPGFPMLTPAMPAPRWTPEG